MVLNLKGKEYPLIYYRTIKEDVKIEKSRFKATIDGQYKEFLYYDTVTNNVIFSEEQVREFILDGHGHNLEFDDRQYTIVHNYLIKFWQYFIKADGLALYITLKSFCIGKNYCWPSLSTLQSTLGMGSVNTLKNKIAVLEHYGFVFRFNCKVAETVPGTSLKNNDESPIYKLRNKVPFLPKELYDELPKELKQSHDIFMNNYMESYNPESLGNLIKYNEIYDEFLAQGELMSKKPTKNKTNNPLVNIEKVKETMTTQDEEISTRVLAFIQTKISKPSFDTWFKNNLIKIREDVVTLYVSNSFAASWINERFKDLIIEGFDELGIKPLDIKIVTLTQD